MPNTIKKLIAAGAVTAASVGVGAHFVDNAASHPQGNHEAAAGQPAPNPTDIAKDENSPVELSQPQTVPVEQYPNTTDIPDNRAPWQHEADLVGPEQATPTIMARIGIAQQNGWHIEGNGADGGEGAFTKITSPVGTAFSSEQPDFNSRVNDMLDTNTEVLSPKDPSNSILNNPNVPDDVKNKPQLNPKDSRNAPSVLPPPTTAEPFSPKDKDPSGLLPSNQPPGPTYGPLGPQGPETIPPGPTPVEPPRDPASMIPPPPATSHTRLV